MDVPRIDALVQRVSTGLGRRSALLAAGGLAALPFLAAAQNGNDLEAARRRGRRGRRGPAGPPAGANLVREVQTCTTPGNETGVGATDFCVAACDDGFAATGGGFIAPDLLTDLALINSSEPEMTGNTPTGWRVTVEYLRVGQDFEFTAYAICAPTGQ